MSESSKSRVGFSRQEAFKSALESGTLSVPPRSKNPLAVGTSDIGKRVAAEPAYEKPKHFFTLEEQKVVYTVRCYEINGNCTPEQIMQMLAADMAFYNQDGDIILRRTNEVVAKYIKDDSISTISDGKEYKTYLPRIKNRKVPNTPTNPVT